MTEKYAILSGIFLLLITKRVSQNKNFHKITSAVFVVTDMSLAFNFWAIFLAYPTVVLKHNEIIENPTHWETSKDSISMQHDKLPAIGLRQIYNLLKISVSSLDFLCVSVCEKRAIWQADGVIETSTIQLKGSPYPQAV